ncbi:PREDICTED: uncharacterized protein LOC109190314 [Ipomoea nil]|uniref:uncharacterized protein LOC109190314 n=1 Tax=Ipomoea nil TaxID=35883 RepID=UPI000900E66E|nr:PREDICTED: uncharacterized protein LOC109190314 [Ipomoea nil]
MKHSKNFSMINRRLLGWKGTLPYSHEGHSGEGGNCNSENEKSTSLDGEFDDSQFSSEDEHGNVADSAATNVVEEFGSSIAQINEVDCVDSEDELRSISSNSDVEEGSNSSLVFSESKFNLEDFQFQEGMIFKDNKEFKWAVERYEALSCRRWDLNGIPCSHAIAAIRTKREVPEDYVHHCYTVEAYMRSYKPAIMPIHPSDLWTKTGQKPPLPPKYKVQPGRPKKLRKRDPIENESVVGDKLISKLSRKGEKKKCSICGQYGHNKRSCKNQLLKLNHLLLKLLMFKSSPLVLLHGLFHHRQLESHQEKEN